MFAIPVKNILVKQLEVGVLADFPQDNLRSKPDLRMPGISGIEVCKKLKSKQTTSNIPIMFYTCIDTPKHLIDYASYGAVDYIQKTMPSDVLIQQIKSVLKVK